MPTKRLSPVSDSSEAPEPPLKKTQRTHEENQERAYIAASRRADRDIEHRVRSALKASECRKKRTGRGLKITREAVMGDEQYESEDDDASRPSAAALRRFSLPATSSSATAGGGGGSSALPNPYLFPHHHPTRAAADRYAEVDALFAKHFPHVRLSSPRWRSPLRHHSTHSALAYHPRRSLSLHGQTPYVPRYPPPPPSPTQTQTQTQTQTRTETRTETSPLLTSHSPTTIGDEAAPQPSPPAQEREARPALLPENAFVFPGGGGGAGGGSGVSHAGGWYHHPIGGASSNPGWHMRSLSLPVPLLPTTEGFAFPFASSSSLGAAGIGEMGLGLGLGLEGGVAPGVLENAASCGDATAGTVGVEEDDSAYVLSSTGGGDGGFGDGDGIGIGDGEDGVGFEDGGPAEPWTDWVNLDGGGETVGGVLLGVEV